MLQVLLSAQALKAASKPGTGAAAHGSSAEAAFLLERNGGMPGLVSLLSSSNAAAAEQSVWALSRLAEQEPLRAAMRTAGAVRRLPALLAPPATSHHAAVLLAWLCHQSAEQSAAALGAGVLPALLPLLAGPPEPGPHDDGSMDLLFVLRAMADGGVSVAARMASGGCVARLVATLQRQRPVALLACEVLSPLFAAPGVPVDNQVVAGCIPSLAALMRVPQGDEHAAKALATLARHSPAAGRAIVAAVLPVVLEKLRGGFDAVFAGTVRYAADIVAGLMEASQRSGDTIAIQRMARCLDCTIQPLARLLKAVPSDEEGMAVWTVMRALSALAKADALSRAAIVSEGAVKPLVDIMRHGKVVASVAAVRTMADLILDGTPEIRAAAVKAGVIPALVALLPAGCEMSDVDAMPGMLGDVLHALLPLLSDSAGNQQQAVAAGIVKYLPMLRQMAEAGRGGGLVQMGAGVLTGMFRDVERGRSGPGAPVAGSSAATPAAELADDAARLLAQFFAAKMGLFDEGSAGPSERASASAASAGVSNAGSSLREARGGSTGAEAPPCCASCGRAEGEAGVAKLKSCSSCHAVRYCSRECQKAHWRAHKAHCKAAAGATVAQR